MADEQIHSETEINGEEFAQTTSCGFGIASARDAIEGLTHLDRLCLLMQGNTVDRNMLGHMDFLVNPKAPPKSLDAKKETMILLGTQVIAGASYYQADKEKNLDAKVGFLKSFEGGLTRGGLPQHVIKKNMSNELNFLMAMAKVNTSAAAVEEINAYQEILRSLDLASPIDKLRHLGYRMIAAFQREFDT